MRPPSSLYPSSCPPLTCPSAVIWVFQEMTGLEVKADWIILNIPGKSKCTILKVLPALSRWQQSHWGRSMMASWNTWMTAVVGCVNGGQGLKYRELVDYFVARCGNNLLTLNMNKGDDCGSHRRTSLKENYFHPGKRGWDGWESRKGPGGDPRLKTFDGNWWMICAIFMSHQNKQLCRSSPGNNKSRPYIPWYLPATRSLNAASSSPVLSGCLLRPSNSRDNSFWLFCVLRCCWGHFKRWMKKT